MYLPKRTTKTCRIMLQNDMGNHYKKPMSLLMLAWHNPAIPYFKRITHMVTLHNLYVLNHYIDRLMQSFF